MLVKVNTKSGDKKNFVESVILFLVKTLKLEKSKFNLSVYTISNFAKEQQMRGAIANIADKELLMFLDSRLKIEELFYTIAHEMVHVKQYAKGQLKTYKKRNGKNGFKWLGKCYETDYLDSPWEIEAFSKERILANKILKVVLQNRLTFKGTAQ